MADNLPEPSVLLADRGYGSNNVRKTMEARNVLPVIPMRKTRKLGVAVDRSLYRPRNWVERCFNRLKSARPVATRGDKTAESFPGFIDINLSDSGSAICHVWMPPFVQVVFEWLRRVIGCGHVSGLVVRLDYGRGPVWRCAGQKQINRASS